MATLKGQNFRILLYNATADKYQCIGMSTACTVTLTNNVQEANTKDDIGMAAKPVTTSKSWQVSVESLNVVDAAAMLTAIKAMQPVTLRWAEVSTDDNQTEEEAEFVRYGEAYISDLTMNFNDREFAAKSIQFTGTGGIGSIVSGDETAVLELGSYTKGQNVRLFLSSDNTTAPTNVIAAAKTLSLHVSLSMENSTTKDTQGDWDRQEPTGLSYDISTGALMRSGETITSQVGAKALSDIETIYENGTPVKWKIANVSGANNRTASTTIASGSCVLTQLVLNGPNRQNADYQATLQGYGDYTVAA